MISLVKQLLAYDKYSIDVVNDKIIITIADALYPEDYIEVNYQKESIVVSEVHRADSRVIVDTTDKQKAVIYACVLCMRLFEPLSRDARVDELKKQVKNDNIDWANSFLENTFSGDTYAIGIEEVFKISLIAYEKRADVKYRNEYLAQDANLVRAYGVLYNYSKKLENIREWYKKIDVDNLKDIRIDEIETLYILGKKI